MTIAKLRQAAEATYCHCHETSWTCALGNYQCARYPSCVRADLLTALDELERELDAAELKLCDAWVDDESCPFYDTKEVQLAHILLAAISNSPAPGEDDKQGKP